MNTADRKARERRRERACHAKHVRASGCVDSTEIPMNKLGFLNISWWKISNNFNEYKFRNMVNMYVSRDTLYTL